MTTEIYYPVRVAQEPEGEPDAETMQVIRDATGRDLEVEEIAAALNASSARPEVEAPLEGREQYRLQMAGIATAALGYWKEGDSIHPDHDTPALRDVATLYAKYAALYKALIEIRDELDPEHLADHDDAQIGSHIEHAHMVAEQALAIPSPRGTNTAEKP